jgi:hypothetical protein
MRGVQQRCCVGVAWWGYQLLVLLAGRTKWGSELRAASEPWRAGTGDGAAGVVVVGLGPDAGMIVAFCR